MDFDELMAKVDAQAAAQHEFTEREALVAEQARVADDQFRTVLRQWVDSAVTRLDEGRIPTLAATEIVRPSPNPPNPPTPARDSSASNARRGLFRRASNDQGAPSVRPTQPAPREIEGWLVYPCAVGVGSELYGRMGGGGGSKWGHTYSYNEPIGGKSTSFALMLTRPGDFIVVACTSDLTNNTFREYVAGSRRVTTSLPIGHPAAESESMVGRSALGFTRQELYAFCGGLFLPTSTAPRRPLYGDEPPSHNGPWDDQLIFWELGIRRLLDRHGKGLAIW